MKKSKKRSIFEKAYKRCSPRGSCSCDKFLKLDFQLKKCKTSKCRKFYTKKLKSLTKKRSKKRSKKDGFIVEFPVKPYNTCRVWKGF